jgi:hypothetical protein
MWRVWGCKYGVVASSLGVLSEVRACQVDQHCARDVTNVHYPQMQVSEQDAPWCTYLMEHLPDSDDEDDLTDFNNRRGMP